MKNIPIVIINYNRLSMTKKLCDQLTLLGYDHIVILDSGSNYKPLLDWYRGCNYEVIRADNIGHKGLWEAGYINRFKDFPYIAVTDSDIELNMNTPNNFIEELILVAKDYHCNKVGLAIEYEDITNPIYKQIITPIEEQYWRQCIIDVSAEGRRRELYLAPVDTSFCIVRPDLPFQYNAIRVAGDYTCKHIPWYDQFDNLTEEQKHYYETADPKIATCVQWYNQWKTQNNK